MATEDMKTLLDAARKLSPEEQQQLIDRLLEGLKTTSPGQGESVVERTYGTIKNLDRETIIRLAEDEEFCGY